MGIEEPESAHARTVVLASGVQCRKLTIADSRGSKAPAPATRPPRSNRSGL